MLQAEHLSKTFLKDGKILRIIEDFSLSLNPGDFVSVVGPSGCGKTTLMMMLGALLTPDSGCVKIDGADVSSLPDSSRRRLRAEKIGFIFQQSYLLPYLNLFDNVMASLIPSENASLENSEDRALELLESFGLGKRLSHYPQEMSAGEQQRTAMARAIIKKPLILLADEPIGNLDPDNAGIILDQIANFARGGGIAVMVTHDMQAAKIAQKCIPIQRLK